MLAALLIGCGGGAERAPPDAAPTELLLMETAPTHVTEAGAMVVEPPNLVPFGVKVYVELADGSLKAYPASGRRGSTIGFRVPLGARSYGYRLSDGYRDTLAYSSAKTVDFGNAIVGRPDRLEAMRATPVVLGFDGLSPWTPSDELYVLSVGAGLHLPLTCEPCGTTATGIPAWMATAAPDLGNDWLYWPLPDPQKGDVAWFWQRTQDVTSNGVWYQYIVKAARDPAVTIRDGVQAYYHEVLADPPQETLDLDWDVSAFVKLAAEVHPRAELVWSVLDLSIAPGGYHGASLFLGPPALVRFSSSSNVVTTLAYGNPFPAEWPEVLSVVTTFDVPHTLADGTVADVYCDISTTVDKAAAAGLRLAPPIGPVWDLRVNGMPAVDDLDGVTTTPLISWILPRVGTPTSYIVTLSRFETYEDFAFDLPVLEIHTRTESVTVPDGVLRPGKPHVVKVTAVWGPALELTEHPFRAAVPTAKADTVSGLVTP